MNLKFDFKRLCFNLRKYYYIYIGILIISISLSFGIREITPKELDVRKFSLDLNKELSNINDEDEINKVMYKIELTTRDEKFIEDAFNEIESNKSIKSTFELVDALRFSYDVNKKKMDICIATDEEEDLNSIIGVVRENLINKLSIDYKEINYSEIRIGIIEVGNSAKYHTLVAILLYVILSVIAFFIIIWNEEKLKGR